MAEKLWYYKNVGDFGGVEQGPLTSAELYEKVRSGVVKSDVWIRRNGLSSRPISQFRILNEEITLIENDVSRPDGRYLWVPISLVVIGAGLIFFSLSLSDGGYDSQEIFLIVAFSLLCFLAVGVVQVLCSIEYSVRVIREIMQSKNESEEKKDS